MSEHVDLDHIRALTRQLYRALGLAEDQRPGKKRIARVEYEDAPQGGSYSVIYDEDGELVSRTYLPVVHRGMATTESEE